MPGPDALGALLAKQEIEQALFRYTRGVDRKDWPLVRSAYHADAIDAHGDFEGPIDAFIDYLMRRHENIEQSLHAVTNMVCDWISDREALVESYFVCCQRLKSASKAEASFQSVKVGKDQTLQLTVVGRYIDRFTLRDGAWRIARRQVTFDVLKAEPTPLGGGLSSPLELSRRDRDDALWRELESR